MPDSADGSRRRELQRRAYAPGGGLTDAEATELQALTAPEVVPAQMGPESASEEPADSAPADSPSPPEDPAPHPATTDPAPEPTNPIGSRRTRRWLAPLAAAVALLLGFGAGWLVFHREDGLSMTAEQRDTWVQLEGGSDYDSGSVELIGAQYGVDAWHATKQEGAHECLVLTGGERRPQANCLPAERERSPYDLQMSTSLKEDGDTISIWAMLTEDAKGDAVVIMQRQNTSEMWDWRSSYTEEELPIAEFLDSSGYDGESLQLLGYDGDLPVWLHQYDRTCLLVASATELIAEACGELDAAANIDLALPGSVYSVRWTDMRGPSLTIIRDAAVTSIDDKTGEVVD